MATGNTIPTLLQIKALMKKEPATIDDSNNDDDDENNNNNNDENNNNNNNENNNNNDNNNDNNDNNNNNNNNDNNNNNNNNNDNNKERTRLTEQDMALFVVYLFVLMPVFNRPWHKAIKKMKSSKTPLSEKTVARCIQGSDHAFLMQILHHHRDQWIDDIQQGRPRLKGMSKGAHKMASDKKGYRRGGDMATAWMETDNWHALVRMGMYELVPSLNNAGNEEDDEPFLGIVDDDDDDSDDDEVQAWGWQS